MTNILKKALSSIKQPIDGRLRNRLSVFLVCITISTFMWGLIKLSRDYEAPVKYNVILEQLPDGKILVGNPDSVITLVMSAKGLDLYSRMFMRDNNSIVISLEGIRLQHDGDLYRGMLRTSKLMKSISQQLPIGAKLINVEPDTLHFIFEKIHRQRVAVHAVVALDFARQYQLYDSLRIRPDSIWVYGQQKTIDTMRYINTEKYVSKNLSSNFRTRLMLVKPQVHPPLSLSSDSVSLIINVEKFTEADLEVPVRLLSDNPELSYRTFPDKVKLTCRVAMRDYKRLDPSMFEAVVDYKNLLNSGKSRLPVQVKRSPAFIKVIRIDPEKVECLILK